MPRPVRKIIVAALVLGAGYYAYTHFMAPQQGSSAGTAGMTMPVSVAVVEPRKVELWNEFSGKLTAVDTADIRPRVAGTIDKVHFTEGQWVKKGDPLFTIDPRPYQATMQAAVARATLADAELARAKILIADKAIPQREYDQRKNDADVAHADLNRAQLDVDYTLIKSPIAGRVGRAEITVGNLVDGGGNAPVLTTVVSSKPIYADFDIDEDSYLRYLKEVAGDNDELKQVAVNLLLTGETEPHKGHVQSFDNQLMTGSGTLRVRAVFANEDGTLIPGLFAHIQMGSAGEKEVLLINEHAINTDQSVKFVWVVGDDNKVNYRPVKLGSMAEGFRVITDGLKPGEKIVIGGTQRVMMPGQPVAPKIVPMEGAPEQAQPEQAPPAEKPKEKSAQ